MGVSQGNGGVGGTVEIGARPAFTPTRILPLTGEGKLLRPPHKSGAEHSWSSPARGRR
jgi:hypothetical protein